MNEHKAIFSYGIFSKKLFATIATTIISSIISSITVQAIDLPAFYRAPLFQGTPKKDLENWTTYFTVGYAFGSGKKAWDRHGEEVDLLNVYGLVNAAHLGLNVPCKQVKTTDGMTKFIKPVTETFWVDEQVIVDDTKVPPLVTAELPPDGILGKFYKDPTKQIALSLSGEVTVQQVDFTLHQNLFAGFYAQVYLPIRQVEVDTIARKIPCTVVCAQEQEALMKLLKVDNPPPYPTSPNPLPDNPPNTLTNIDLILKENCLTGLKEPFKKSGISDMLVSLGWQVFDDHSFGTFVKTVEAAVQIGALVPLADERDENHLYSVPLGYNEHMGVNARFYVQVGIADIFAVGAQTGVTTFIRKDRKIRMETDKRQSGIIVLGKGKAEVDQGSMWDLGAYGKVHNFCKGLEAIIGYSFTRQEPTFLEPSDDFLQAVYDRELSRNPPRIFPRSDVVNSDQRYWGWEQHVVHAVVQYDFKKHKDLWFSPCVKVSGSVPIAGRRAWIVNMFGASFGVTLDWDF